LVSTLLVAGAGAGAAAAAAAAEEVVEALHPESLHVVL